MEIDYEDINKYKDIWCLNEEVWTPMYKVERAGKVYNLQGLYEVSTYGRVRGLERIIKTKKGKKRIIPNRILILTKNHTGYYTANFSLNNISMHFAVHRLVALYFISNPNDYPIVNHMDENPSDNCVWNLEWCTNKYNCGYGTVRIRQSKNNFNRKRVMNKPIIRYTMDGIVDKRYKDIYEVIEDDCFKEFDRRKLEVGIFSCLNGWLISSHGYIWKYDDDTELDLDNIKNARIKRADKPILRYDVYGNFIKRYENIIDITHETGYDSSCIGKCCRHEVETAYRNFWRYEDDPSPINFISPLKPVLCYTREGQFVRQFDSVVDASKFVGCAATNISSCCRHKSKTIKDYIFRFVDDDAPVLPIKKQERKVCLLNDNMDIIEVYDTITEASKANNCLPSGIVNCCKGRNKSSKCKGKIFRYMEDVESVELNGEEKRTDRNVLL